MTPNERSLKVEAIIKSVRKTINEKYGFKSCREHELSNRINSEAKRLFKGHDIDEKSLYKIFTGGI